MNRALLLAAMALAGCEPESPDLYAPPRPLATFDRIPEPKKTPPHPAPGAPRLSPRGVEQLFWEILDLRAEWAFSRRSVGGIECGSPDPWLSEELRSYLLEALLFARAFPAFTERYALAALNDPDPDLGEVYLLLEMLRQLASRDHPKLEAAISRWVAFPDSSLSIRAVWLLSTPSRLPRHRSLLWERSARGDRDAFESLTYDDHPDTRDFFESLKRNGTVIQRSRNILPELCDEALSKMAIHLAPDREAQIERMLKAGRHGTGSFDYYWASNVAGRSRSALLRRAVEAQLLEYRRQYGPLLEHDALDEWETSTELDPQRIRRRFSERFAVFSDIREIPDEFDRVLIQLVALGGELTPIEQRRLHTFGFVGDPEERLLDIMRIRGEQRRPMHSLFLASLRYVPGMRTY